MATVISGQKSTYGSPYAFYTLDLSYSSRTINSIVISYTITSHLQYSNSYTSYPLTATVEVGGYQSSVKLKGTETWSGTANHTANGSFTVSGLSASTSALSTYLKVTSSSGNVGGTMSWVQGNNLAIPEQTKYTITYNANGGSNAPPSQSYYYGGNNINLSTTVPTRSGYNFLGWSLSSTATSPSYYAGEVWSSSNGANYTLYAVWEVANGKSTITLSGSTINLDSPFTLYTIRQNTSNTHTIVLTLPTGSYTLATGIGASHTFTLPASTWARYFTNSKSVDGTITVTTYSGSTSLGSVSQGVTVALPENIGKPDKPTAVLSSERFADATIDLKKPTFKYGATFKEWKVESNIGKAKIIGNRIHVGVDPTINKTVATTIRAVDSRGFMSDPVSVQWRRRKRGNSIFINGKWISGISYIYEEDKWVEYKHPYIYLEEKDLVSKDEYEILDANGLELKGDDSWENIH